MVYLVKKNKQNLKSNIMEKKITEGEFLPEKSLPEGPSSQNKALYGAFIFQTEIGDVIVPTQKISEIFRKKFPHITKTDDTKS